MTKDKKTDERSLPEYLFRQGTNYKAWEYLGAHRTADGYVFRTWAPSASSVSLCADFTSWIIGLPMVKDESGIWIAEIKTDESFEGQRYKFKIKGVSGEHMKSDPYGRRFECPPDTASIVCTDVPYEWGDGEFLENRKKLADSSGHFRPYPLNIYEVHLGSWHTKDDECTKDREHYLSYRELGDRLAEYASDMGFTHVELLPVTEHPFDGSWGYQVCGYYAPTSRFGTPEDFKYFVDTLHRHGIGVILDWVPAHFPKDEHGLYEYDGGPLYEYQGRDRMEHRGWGTRFFDVGREEVQSFLISNALYWLEEYHADGLRVDAAAAMLYLDFDRLPGEWIPNVNGGRENLEAVAFLRKLNSVVLSRHPDAIMAAEESTAWPMVTKPADVGGLGFNYKWNMGFANDMYDYVAKDPVYRRYIHERLTFPMMYAFSENFILPVSHDEVVHGKKSLVDKMFGEYDEKFALMRTYLSFMYTMPGAKLLFMGTEFAQFREWDYENALEWFMLKYPRHSEMKQFVHDLCHLYKDSPELWEIDDGWDGFEWIHASYRDENLVSYKRTDTKGNSLICVLHFAPNETHYNLPADKGEYEIIISSDEYRYGGGAKLCAGKIKPVKIPVPAEKGEKVKKRTEYRYELSFDLPGNTAIIIRKI